MSLTLRNVSLSYPDGDGQVTALADVSMRVAPGELLAVVGPSGSGKSSLLSASATLMTPDTGTVLIDDVDVTSLSAAQRTSLRASRIGIVFQQPNLVNSLTAQENLLVTDHFRGGSVAAARPAAMELLHTVGLADKQHRRPHQLSGGERQRVNIARALTGHPSVLLVDEPTAALDHTRGRAIVDLITTVTRRFSIATVLVTHDTEYLSAADTVLRMRDGRLTETVSQRAGA